MVSGAKHGDCFWQASTYRLVGDWLAARLQLPASEFRQRVDQHTATSTQPPPSGPTDHQVSVATERSDGVGLNASLLSQ